jgi:hypothetical protein
MRLLPFVAALRSCCEQDSAGADYACHCEDNKIGNHALEVPGIKNRMNLRKNQASAVDQKQQKLDSFSADKYLRCFPAVRHLQMLRLRLKNLGSI